MNTGGESNCQLTRTTKKAQQEIFNENGNKTLRKIFFLQLFLEFSIIHFFFYTLKHCNGVKKINERIHYSVNIYFNIIITSMSIIQL